MLSKAQVREKLAKVLKAKEECITIFGMKAKFGGGRSSAFALVYDSHDEKKQYDSKKALKKVSPTLQSDSVAVGQWTRGCKGDAGRGASVHQVQS